MPLLGALLELCPGHGPRAWQRALGEIVDELPPMGSRDWLPDRRFTLLELVSLIPDDVLVGWTLPFGGTQVEVSHTDRFVERYTAPVGNGPDDALWWTTPTQGSTRRRVLTTTRGPWHRAPCVEAFGTEDSFWDTSDGPAHWRTIEPTFDPVLYEIDGPPAWRSLVEAYPRRLEDPSPSNAAGSLANWFGDPFYVPDWAKVSSDFDAVHLTQLGYVTTAYAPIPCRGGTTSVCGWGPDLTAWLRHPSPGA